MLLGVLMSGAVPAVAINPPTNFSAEAGNQSVTLRWTASAGAVNYNLQQSVNGGAWNLIAEPTASSISYVRSNLTNGTSYSYRISASGGGTTSAWSNTVSATPSTNPPIAPPAPPSNFVATGQMGQITLTWSPAPYATRHDLWRRTGSNAYSFLTTVGNIGSYVDAGLTNGLRYDYAITGYNALGGGSYWSYASAAPGAPGSAPADFSAVPGNAQVSLSWSPVFGATYYNVWRKKSTDSVYPAPFNVTGTSFVDSGLTNGVLYNYALNAGNANGASSFFSYLDATPDIPVNRAPVANADSYSANQGITLSVSAAGVLANDTDADGNALTAVRVTDALHGSVTLNANGSFTYRSNSDYYGPDSFTYKVYDGALYSNTTTVNLAVNHVNQPPTAVNDSAGTTMGVAVDIPVLANDSDIDGDALSILTITAQPTKGTAVIVGSVICYTPNAGATGTDSFGYLLGDGHGGTASNPVVTVTINAANRAPVANTQSVLTNEDTAKPITLSATDADNDPLTYTIVTQPTKGTLSGTAPNLTYTPNLNANGSDSFSFKANDGKIDSNTATVNITVNPVNDAPVAVAQSISTDKNVAKSGTLTATDVDSSTLTFNIVNPPANGTVTLTPPTTTGAFTYTPRADYVGTDSFTFRANDGSLDSSPATVSITVNAPTSSGSGNLSSFQLLPTTVVGGVGGTSTGTVRLVASVSSDSVITLSSDNPAVQVPVSVPVPANASSTEFPVTTSTVSSVTKVNITATLGTGTVTATLTVTPRFVITNINNGDVLSGNTQVFAEVYDQSIDPESLVLKIAGVEVGMFLPSANNVWVCQVGTPYLSNGTGLSLVASDARGGDQLRTVAIQNSIFNLDHDVIFDVSPDANDVPNTAHITTSLSANSNWVVKISNDSGVVIKTFNGIGSLVDITWNGMNDTGVVQPNGCYLVSIEAQASTTLSASRGNSVTGMGLRSTAMQGTTRVYNSSLPAEYINFVINKHGIVDTLVLIDESAVVADAAGSAAQHALDYSRFIRTCLSNKVGVTIDDQASPIIIGFGVKITSKTSMAAQYAARINKQFTSMPLKVVYVNSHGSNNYPAGNTTNGTPRFGINSHYKWWSGPPTIQPSARDVFFNVKDMVYRWNYGDLGDPSSAPTDPRN